MNTVIRPERIRIAATIAAVLMLLNAHSATTAQPPAQHWFGTELAAVVAAATRDNPLLIREDRDFKNPITRDDECDAYTKSADLHRRNVITSRLP